MCVTNADLDLNSKLIIFEGNNGQGKSSVMEAVALCFSEHKRSDSVKEMIQKGYEHAFIYLELEYNNELIVFDVSLNERNETPFKRDVLYKGKHYINSEVTELLDSLNFKFFSEIILSMQGQDDITLMTPIQRANLLQSLFQFNFDDKIKNIQDKLDEYNNNSVSFKERINFLTKEIEQKKSKKSSFVFKKQNITNEEYLKIKNEINEYTEKINDINNDLLESNKLHQRKNEIFNLKLQLNLKELKYKYDEAKKSKKSLEVLNYSEKIAEINKRIENINKNLQTLKKENDKLNIEEDNITNSIQQYKNDQNILNVQLKDVTKKIELANKGICPECGQSTCNIDKDALYKAKIDYENNIQAKENLIIEKQNELSKIYKKEEELKDKINQITKDIQNAQLEKSTLDNTNDIYLSKIISLDQWSKLETDITNAEDKEKTFNKEIEDIEAKIASTNSRVAEKESFQKRKDELKLIVKEYDDINSSNVEINAQIKLINDEIDASTETLNQIKILNISNDKDIQVYEEAKKILSRELPNYLIVKTCSKLEEEMNNFVQIVFPSFRLRLLQSKKGVEFFYSLDKNTDMSNLKQLINSKMASGYERAVLGIAFKAALCKAYGLTFAAFDEIDQAASDENSIKTFESLIYSNIFNQIFVITHKNATKEILKQLEDSSISYHVSKGNFTLNDSEDS